MHAPGPPVVAVAAPVRRPRTVLAAGALTIVGAVVGLLVPFGLQNVAARVVMPLMGDVPPPWAVGLVFVLVAAVAWGVPAAQLAGAVRLLNGRGRRLLLVSGPVSLLPAGWALSALVARPHDVGWQVMVVLAALPVVGALLASLPPAGRWVAAGGSAVRPGVPASAFPAPSPADSPAPAAAVVAAALALVGGVIPLVFGLVGLLVPGAPDDPLSGGEPTAWVALRLLVLGATVLGAVLLLGGRSWLVLALSGGVLAVLVAVGYAVRGAHGAFVVVAVLSPSVTTVLAALPGVRRWVAARRAARVGGRRS